MNFAGFWESNRAQSAVHFQRKPLQELSRFFGIFFQLCAYFIGLNWLLWGNEMLTKKIWRLPEVLNQTGLSRSTIYEMIGRREFPRQINLGPRAVSWPADDALGWIDSKIRDAQPSDVTCG